MNNTLPGLTTMTQGTLETFMKWNAAAVGGIERTARYCQTTMESVLRDMTEANRSLMSAKSAADLVEVPSRLSRQSIQAFYQHGKNLCELQSAVWSDILNPLNETKKPEDSKKADTASESDSTSRIGRKAA